MLNDSTASVVQDGKTDTVPAGWIISEETSGRITSEDSLRRTASKDTSGRIAYEDSLRRTASKDTSGRIAYEDSSGGPQSKDTSGRIAYGDPPLRNASAVLRPVQLRHCGLLFRISGPD